jgi:alpha-glucosidase (family GH31 glycosyl hydrolase)
MTAHTRWSVLKSTLRLVGCAGVAFFRADFGWFAGWFAAAEMFGIIEEIGT